MTKLYFSTVKILAHRDRQRERQTDRQTETDRQRQKEVK